MVTTNQTLPRRDFEEAVARMPVAGPGALQGVRGPSYLYMRSSMTRECDSPREAHHMRRMSSPPICVACPRPRNHWWLVAPLNVTSLRTGRLSHLECQVAELASAAFEVGVRLPHARPPALARPQRCGRWAPPGPNPAAPWSAWLRPRPPRRRSPTSSTCPATPSPSSPGASTIQTSPSPRGWLPWTRQPGRHRRSGNGRHPQPRPRDRAHRRTRRQRPAHR